MGKLNIPRHIPTPDEAFNEMLGVKAEPSRNGIIEIGIDKLLQYSKHPFQIKENKVLELIDSINEQGILMPLLVRSHPLKVGCYEVLAGHHRCEASKRLNLNSLPCIVKNVDDNMAALIVVESNKQRGFADMLPSEIAKALKLEYDALKCQGKRTDLLVELDGILSEENSTSALLEQKLETSSKVGQQNDMSSANVRRYIRLNYLIDPLINLVDNGKMALYPAVDLSYLTEDEQQAVVNVLDTSDYKVDMKKAEKLKEYSYENKLNSDSVKLILSGVIFEAKEKKTNAIKLPIKKIKEYLPSSLSSDGYEDYIVRALEFYKDTGSDDNN